MLGSPRTLVLSPHTDDAELGCGGTISRLIHCGSEVEVAVLSRCEESLPKGDPPDTLELECRRALKALGVQDEKVSLLGYRVRRFQEARQEILEDLVKINRRFRPQLVLCTSPGDVHQDHAAVAQEAKRAFKHCSLLGYELPWNDSRFQGDVFIQLEEEDLQRKQQAAACYESQVRLNRSYFRPELLREWAGLRGLQANCNLAECFTVMRMIL